MWQEIAIGRGYFKMEDINRFNQEFEELVSEINDSFVDKTQ